MSGAASRETLSRMRRWAEREARGADDDGAVIQLRTRGLTEADVLATWRVADVTDAGAWADDARGAAQSDADGRGADGAYSLVVVVDGADRASLALRVRCADLAEVEPADVAGMLAQSMRHTEAMVRHMLATTQRCEASYREITSTLVERIRALESSRAEAYEAEREGLRAAALAEGTDAESERKSARQEKLLSYAELLAQKYLLTPDVPKADA